MTYFLIAYLCITGPVVAWIVLAREERKGRIIALGIYVLFSLGLFALLRAEGGRLERMYDDLVKAPIGNDIATLCQGSLDEVTAGLRRIPVGGKDSISAAVERKLVLRGWIGSENAKDHGTAVRMTPKGKDHPCLEFQVTTQRRPDVAVFMANPLMESSGFLAEAIVPGDFPQGRCQIKVECRNASTRDQFVPGCEILVISAAEGAVLDAPLERELEERKMREVQAVSPKPRITPARKPKRLHHPSGNR